MRTQSTSFCPQCGAEQQAMHYVGVLRKFCSTSCANRGRAPKSKISTEARFWAKVDRRGPDDCWPWLGRKTPKGYGQTHWQGRQERAHRVAFAIANGSIDPELPVLHACEDRYPPGDISSRACNNPAHLSQGTQLENVRQRDERGRGVSLSGELNGSSKLSAGDVSEIRRRYAEGGTSLQRLANEFNAGKTTMGRIVRGESWKTE